MITLEEYLLENDSSPFGRWIDILSVPAAARVSKALARLEAGNTSNIKWFDGLGEYKINWGPGYRIWEND